ncbi:hypothetical protein MTYM_00746 [Methylococcales bacterium]|nr:hypothetical protein MTYM_00746 [Methylococcales bacterium]
MAFSWFIFPQREHLIDRQINSASANFLLQLKQRTTSINSHFELGLTRCVHGTVPRLEAARSAEGGRDECSNTRHGRTV